MTSPTNDPPKKRGPRTLGGHGGGPSQQPPSQSEPPATGQRLPPETREYLQQQKNDIAHTPTKEASYIDSYPANEGDPNREVQQPAGMTISLWDYFSGQKEPEEDTVNRGYKIPKYFTEAIDTIAFLAKIDKQKVVTELIYAGVTGPPYKGVLSDIPPEFILRVFAEARAKAMTAVADKNRMFS